MAENNGITKQDLVDMETRLETRLKLHVSEEIERLETKLLAEFWKMSEPGGAPGGSPAAG